MHIPTYLTTEPLASPSPSPTLLGPGTCFVCDDPSDTILIIQILILTLLTVPLILISLKKVKSTSTFITVYCISYIALIIHATFKFFLDDWATSHDRPADWKRFVIYGVTKQFSIFGILQIWLGSGIAFWIVRRWQVGAQKEGQNGEAGGHEEDTVGDESLLLGESREDDEIEVAGDDNEGRFRVKLKGRWWDGARHGRHDVV